MDQDFDSLGLSAFLTVCNTKSFTRAAQMLHITQPALSQRIRRFEDSLGTTLIYRSHPDLSLTSAGLEVFTYGQRKKALLDELRFQLRTHRSGTHFAGILRIGAFSSILRSIVMPSLAPFLREHRDICIEFIGKEMFELPEMLMRGAIDIAILDYHFADDRIKRLHICTEDYVMIESDQFNVPEIFLDHDVYDQKTLDFLLKVGKPKQKLQRSYCDDIYGVIDGVRLGLGRAVVPRHLLTTIDGFRIIDEACTITSPVIAHLHHHDHDSTFYQRIINELQRNCGDMMHR